MVYLRLEDAYLCMDCNCIGNSPIQCPACASEIIHRVNAWIDRQVNYESLCEALDEVLA